MQISTKSKMAFTASAKNIQQAINKVQSITKFVDCFDAERIHALAVIDKKAYIVGLTPDAFALVEIDGAVGIKPGAVSFSAEVVVGLIKGRDDLEVSSDKALSIKAIKGKYHANVEFFQLEDADGMRINDALSRQKAKELEPKTIAAIRKGVKATELTNFYDPNSPILARVRVTEKSVSVLAADNYHIAYYNDKIKSKIKLQFAIPTKTFNLIDRFIGEDKAEFVFGDGKVRVQGKHFIISLPETQTGEDEFGLYLEYLKNIPEATTTFDFNSAGFKTIENMFAIINEDTKMTLSVVKDAVKIEMSTKGGAVKDAFKTKMKGKEKDIRIDPRIFQDLFKQVDGKIVPMSIHLPKTKGQSGGFKIESDKSETATLIQVGTFHDE